VSLEFFFILIVLFFLGILASVAVIFFIRLTLHLEKVAKHLDSTLTQLDIDIPVLAEQSKHTLEAIEYTAHQMKGLMDDIKAPIAKISTGISPFLNPAVLTAVVAFLNGFSFFRKLFGKGKADSEQDKQY